MDEKDGPGDSKATPQVRAQLILSIFDNGKVALHGAHHDPYVTIDLLTHALREVTKQIVHMAASGQLEQQRIIRPFPEQ